MPTDKISDKNDVREMVKDLQLHYKGQYADITVEIYFEPTVTLSDLQSEDFYQYRIHILPILGNVAESNVQYLVRYGGDGVKVYKLDSDKRLDITELQIDGFHVGKAKYLPVATMFEKVNIAEIYYSTIFSVFVSQPPQIGQYEIEIDGKDLFKINGVACSINIPPIPISVIAE